jgi:diaminohydroxyphosphoribosylaminopyrimidine deaminase/5-amino-6-(5-phosphoribosylamino)uracil reductase
LLDTLSREGVLQVLLEGGPTVAGEWHRAGLVDEYLWYVAPGLLGSCAVADTASPVGRGSISDMWRGEIVDLRQLGDDVRIVMRPRAAPSAAGGPEHRGVRRGKT